MRLLATIFFIIPFCGLSYSQQPISFDKILRFDEDYTFLKKDTSKSWYKSFKYGEIGKKQKSYISNGGEIRYQYFYFKNEQWGDEPADKDGYILTRYLFHTDIHFNNYFRTFMQLQSSFANGKITQPSPVEQNLLDLHQAFTDITLPVKSTKLLLRLGRQEFYLGSGRLITVRDGPNNRQSFDAAKFALDKRTFHSELFWGNYVVSQPNILDDKFLNPAIQIWGNYNIFKNIPVINNIDLYYFGLHRTKSIYDSYIGSETRHSIGARIWKNSKTWKYDFEGVYQFGSAGNNTINAWTISSNTSYKFENNSLKPTIGLKTELVSGDKEKGDGKLNTFNALFPKGNYFGWAALIGPANLFDIHPSIEFEITKKLKLNIDNDIFWRLSKNDGIYSPSTLLLYSGQATYEKFIGSQYSLDFTYTPNPHLYFRPEVTYFKTGDYLSKVSTGKDIFLVACTAQLKF